MRNNVNNHHGRTSVQHPTRYQAPQREPLEQNNGGWKPNLSSKKDHSNPHMSANTNISGSDKVNHGDHETTQHIPIMVNGELIKTKHSKVELFNVGDKGSMQNTMSELIIELTNKRNSYLVSKKRKIIFVGDNHVRGFANVVKNLVSNNFEIYSVLKPGSSSCHLNEIASQEIEKLNWDDFLIICSGTNNLATNKSTLAFQNIADMIKKNHSNIILVNIHYRYDSVNTSIVNEGIG